MLKFSGYSYLIRGQLERGVLVDAGFSGWKPEEAAERGRVLPRATALGAPSGTADVLGGPGPPGGRVPQHQAGLEW